MTNMKRCRVSLLGAICLALGQLAFAQTPTETASALPPPLRFGGTVKGADGSARTGAVGITFALYAEQTGGAPLWQETQNLTADGTGHYSALLGSTKTEGLPAELFTSEQAHWVGVQVEGQPEQPRVLLVSTPYALKAGDAETIGGYPPSAFVLASQAGSPVGGAPAAGPETAGVHPQVAGNAVPATDTENYIPVFTSTSGAVANSVIQQSGARIGINVKPAFTLDVYGTGFFQAAASTSEITTAVFAKNLNTYEQSAAIGGVAGGSTTSNITYGVQGTNSNVDSLGVGVAGSGTTISGQGVSVGNEAGVWGDASGTTANGQAGVIGTADNGYAVYAQSNGSGAATVYADNMSTTASAVVFQTQGSGAGTGGYCIINVIGQLTCSGTITSTAQTSDGHQVKLYTVASPENWFEDFGSGQLSGGSAQVPLDPTFASTANTGEAYRVFLTPNGDCKGLYVASKTAGGFEVRELGGGTSTISFDYRIVAKRRGYESNRLEDVTEQMSAIRQQSKRSRSLTSKASQK